MKDFRRIHGFDEGGRLPDRTRFNLTPTTLKARLSADQGARGRLARVARHAPEVFVRVTGRNGAQGGLLAHLNYMSRDGRLPLEDRDQNLLVGRSTLAELAQDWTAESLTGRPRVDSKTNLCVVLSMPPLTDPAIVRDAARAFAQKIFEEDFDYVFVLHTDTDHPHVHLAVRVDGRDGQRLNPWINEKQAWRETFAAALRERGVDAEATPRRARGITRKSEHPMLRRLRLQFEAGLGEPARTLRAAYEEAARAAFFGETELKSYEARIVVEQRTIRNTYRSMADHLRRSPDRDDQSLGLEVEKFVRSMPAPDSRRLAFARELRAEQERHVVRERSREREHER
jgi:hypothetical protein